MKITNPSRRLTINYLLSLLIILALVGTSQYLVRSSLDKQVSDGALINAGAKQVYLSQQLVKQVLVLQQTKTEKQQADLVETMEATRARWNQTHHQLSEGLATQKLAGSNEGEIIRGMYSAIEYAQSQINASVEQIVYAHKNGKLDTVLAVAGRTLLDNEDRYATGMDRIVYQYALEAKEKVKTTEQTQILLFIAIVITLVLIALLIFRPAVRRIQEDVKILNQTYQNLENQKAKLEQAYTELKSTQEQLVQSEKMAALGQLIAGIAHEINTPLGAIHASNGTLAKSVDGLVHDLPEIGRAMTPVQQAQFHTLIELSKSANNDLSSREERQIKKDLQQKLEDLEVKNAPVLARELVKIGLHADNLAEVQDAFASPESERMIHTAGTVGKMRMHMQYIDLAVSKMQKIVFALKTYNHRQIHDEPILADLNKNMEAVLVIYHNQLKYGIELEKNLQPDLPETFCWPDELNQVWTNLIHNSIQAMDGKGTMRIGTQLSADGQWIEVEVTDFGPGIPPEVQARMWEAFYTTKPAGEGSGMGLDIVRKIITKHGGEIQVDSHPGKTTFRVRIPHRPTLASTYAQRQEHSFVEIS